MNLHVTNDDYGFFPAEIAKRIRNSGHSTNNIIVNLSMNSQFRDEMITYISISYTSFKNYIKTLPVIDKIIFHPYNVNSLRFLSLFRKRFPHVKVYWVCWSYELYHRSDLLLRLYEPYSAKYLKGASIKRMLGNLWGIVKYGSLYNYSRRLTASYSGIDFFCSFLPSDYDFMISISPKKDIKYVPFSYLSLATIIPDMDKLHATGNKIMVGHSASPQGNHFEVLEKLATINKDFDILLPLAYGDNKYAKAIHTEAKKRFSKLTVLEDKVSTGEYYHFLTQASWAIMNVKVQQGLGNILALLWMGVKLFLDENTSSYTDFKKWGAHIYSLDDITEKQLSQKLTEKQAEQNRKILLERFSELQVQQYWQPILE